MSAYDQIARLYDPWSRTVVEDVAFYVDEARRAEGPVLELAVGTGRIAVPIAAAGVAVTGVDSSAGMLEVARERATAAGVGHLLDLRYGDMRDPPVEDQYALIAIPFRSLLHMETDADRRSALQAARKHLAPDGRFVFDVFTPAADDIADTHGRWIERELGIWERADWHEETRTLVLRVRGSDSEAEMSLAWLSVPEWRTLLDEEGFEVEALYGWFDRSPWSGGEDSVWICRRHS
jgi:SAM-dependent methyltransferase